MTIEPTSGIRYEVDSTGIARVELNLPGKKVNLLTPALLDELDRTVESIRSDPKVRGALFLSGKPDQFIAGAEIDAESFIHSPEVGVLYGNRGRAVLDHLASLSVPTLALIHGACLGGGAELALACRYRIATDHRKTRIGFPEVLLGILPAWGGTTRLPRLVPLERALGLLLTGRTVTAREALRMGFVDRVITPVQQEVQARAVLSEMITRKDRPVPSGRKRPGLRTRLIEKTGPGRALLFYLARRRVRKETKGRYPAPFKILEVVQRGIRLPVQQALSLEEEALRYLVHHPVTPRLLHVFTLQRLAGKLPEAIEALAEKQSIRKVGVIGAGTMGSGIAHWVAHQEIPVRIKDISPEALLNGLRLIRRLFSEMEKRRRLTSSEAERRMRLVSVTTDFTGFSNCDLIIEASFEDLAVKQELVRQLQADVKNRFLFATNTSSLSVSRIAEAASDPGRVVGLHFFNPVHRMPLVEVVHSGPTSDEALAAAVGFVRRIGKTPLIVRDSPGFLVNRILDAYGNEALLLLEEGTAVETIDGALRGFGMPMGFFEMADLVGNEIIYHAGRSIAESLQLDPKQRARLLDRLVSDRRLGKKTRMGFYRYDGKKPAVDHAYLDPRVEEVRSSRGAPTVRGASGEEILERTLLAMINTAAGCLENRVVASPGDVDLGLILGAGFPPFRGGLLKQADEKGSRWLLDRLKFYSERCGPRFEPSPLISRLADENRGFYS
jgi:3-hydroxyacyl-CoA dehydrogenase/enoyl-CoA hydratase/3-hydroxybutyryl-CoA epimerase